MQKSRRAETRSPLSSRAFVRGGDHVEQVLRQRQRRLDVDPDAPDRGGARDRGHGVLIIMGQRTDKARRPPGRAGRGAGQLDFPAKRRASRAAPWRRSSPLRSRDAPKRPRGRLVEARLRSAPTRRQPRSRGPPRGAPDEPRAPGSPADPTGPTEPRRRPRSRVTSLNPERSGGAARDRPPFRSASRSSPPLARPAEMAAQLLFADFIGHRERVPGRG